ncbi:MAG: hypothetical protein M1834_006944 [Cirrosporium novae-zelandiae]|nr:MAG: hypothetical protein M1834_006944 [Cirrosporium novae-zelandiae]
MSAEGPSTSVEKDASSPSGKAISPQDPSQTSPNGHVPSTELVPNQDSSSTNPSSSKQDAPDHGNKDAHLSPESEGQNGSLKAESESSKKSKKKRSFLKVPSRTSSMLKHQTSAGTPPSTSVSPEDTPTKEAESSNGGPNTGNGVADMEKSDEANSALEGQDGSKPERPKKGVSRFLSFLNCCSYPDNANTVENRDSLQPPRKTQKYQSPRGRQPTPIPRQDVSATESSTAESKDNMDEKANVSPFSDQQTIVQEDSTMGDEHQDEEMAEKAKADNVEALTESKEETQAESQGSEQKSPELAVAPHLDTSDASLQGPSQPPDVNVNIEEPTPTMVAAEEAISDRTAQQAKRDEDIEMSEAPPVAPVSEKASSSEVPEEENASPKIALPPPPPLEEREAQLGLGPASDIAPDENQQWLLPPIKPEFRGKKCLVLDLDETLVHSSFKILQQADFTIPVEIEGQYHNVYVIKRPGVDQFMKRVGELYEVVVFTASVSKYGDPLLDQLDIHNVVHHRLFRESCYNHQGNYVKDLSQVGRDLKDTIIIDNSPTSYIFHPQHAVPISSWFSDAHDNELLDLIPVLEDLAGSQVRDVSLVLDVSL